ncbi:lipopolysaccharide biosynthesis protein [Poseidonocella sp. HB161398]|uniref:lipopolysaccharide biosynthesis protein n=1 Tax=Poseidonocella sp. HB161398 TaxID=2320855 RepID=UPI0011082773|nr:lipopolysaccharide biosynthesis protein [Poseidonocella sp. HB161398]
MNDRPTGPAGEDPRDAYFDVSALRQDIGRQVGSASRIILLVALLKSVQQFAGLAILARLIPPAEYGLFALSMPAVTLALALSNMGLPQAIIQRARITHGEVSTLFWMNLAFSVIAAAAVAACSGLAAHVYGEPRLAAVFAWVSLGIVFSAMAGQYAAILRRKLRVRSSEMMLLYGELAGLALAIGGALLGMSYWALVLQQVAAPLISVLLLALASGWLPSAPWKARLRGSGEALAFGSFVAGQAILNRLTMFAGTAVSGAVIDPAASGLFHRARLLGDMPTRRVLTPLAGAFIPTLSRLQDDPPALRDMYVRLISRANLLVLPAAVLMASGAAPIVQILLGRSWDEAVPLVFWMSLFILRAGVNSGLQYVMIACGQSRPLFANAAIRLAIVAATVWYASRYGLVAMTAANMLVEVFLTLPLMIARTVRHTPLTLRCVATAGLGDMLLAVLFAALLIYGANPVLEPLPAAAHLAALAVLTGLLYALRIAVSPGLRAEAAGLLRRLAGRLGRKR